MPVTTKLYEDENYVHHHLTGEIDQNFLIEVFDNNKTLTGLKSDTAVIWEFERVKIPNLTSTLNSTRKIADHIKDTQVENRKNYRVALVADSDLIYGMARMYQTIAEFLPVTFRVFRSLGKAREWAVEK